MTNEQPKRLSDLRSGRSDGATPCDPYIGQDLTIQNFEELPSIFDANSTYIVITALDSNNQPIRIRCSGQLVRRRLLENKEMMPYVAQINKKGNSYVLE